MAQLLSTGCSSQGLGLCPQRPRAGSKQPVALVPGDLVPSSDLCRHQGRMLRIDIQAGKTHKYNK